MITYTRRAFIAEDLNAASRTRLLALNPQWAHHRAALLIQARMCVERARWQRENMPDA